MKEEMIKDRNKEIEAIIEKLGDETHNTHKQLVSQYEGKALKLEEKHRKDLAEKDKVI